MKFYYSHQAKRWLTEEEQSRFHLDYDPQPTEELAIKECRRFCLGYAKMWKDIADRLPNIALAKS